MHVSMYGPSQKFQQDGVDFMSLFKVRDMTTIIKGMKFDLRDDLSQFIAVVKRNGRIIASPQQENGFFYLAHTLIIMHKGIQHMISDGRKDSPLESFILHLDNIARLEIIDKGTVKEI